MLRAVEAPPFVDVLTGRLTTATRAIADVAAEATSATRALAEVAGGVRGVADALAGGEGPIPEVKAVVERFRRNGALPSSPVSVVEPPAAARGVSSVSVVEPPAAKVAPPPAPPPEDADVERDGIQAERPVETRAFDATGIEAELADVGKMTEVVRVLVARGCPVEEDPVVALCEQYRQAAPALRRLGPTVSLRDRVATVLATFRQE